MKFMNDHQTQVLVQEPDKQQPLPGSASSVQQAEMGTCTCGHRGPLLAGGLVDCRPCKAAGYQGRVRAWRSD